MSEYDSPLLSCGKTPKLKQEQKTALLWKQEQNYSREWYKLLLN